MYIKLIFNNASAIIFRKVEFAAICFWIALQEINCKNFKSWPREPKMQYDTQNLAQSNSTTSMLTRKFKYLHFTARKYIIQYYQSSNSHHKLIQQAKKQIVSQHETIMHPDLMISNIDKQMLQLKFKRSSGNQECFYNTSDMIITSFSSKEKERTKEQCLKTGRYSSQKEDEGVYTFY